MRLILIAALCLAATPADAQAWFHWTAYHATHRCPPAGKPAAPINDGAR